jgi:hypothetical protein
MVSIKNFFFLFLIASLMGCSKTEDYKTETYLSANEQTKTLRKILPYFAKLPKGYTYERRFESVLDTFYSVEIKKYEFQHYFINPKDSFHYFMVNRPAPSLYQKKISIAGKFKVDKNGTVTDYEEAFWTFKMKKEELSKKGEILFATMVKGENLNEYMPGKKLDEWIEFPDDKCSYNKNEQRWIVKM